VVAVLYFVVCELPHLLPALIEMPPCKLAGSERITPLLAANFTIPCLGHTSTLDALLQLFALLVCTYLVTPTQLSKTSKGIPGTTHHLLGGVVTSRDRR
jgi:hypothetical protein